MGIQDRDYYWEKRGGVRPGRWARVSAAVWLVRYRLVNQFGRLPWSLRFVLWLFFFAGVAALYRWGRSLL